MPWTDVVGATPLSGCSNPTPCVDVCAPAACGFGTATLVSLLQDDGSGGEEDAGGFAQEDRITSVAAGF